VSTELGECQTIKVANIGKECLRSADELGQLLERQKIPDVYKVAVVGRFKAGKSTFVNELLSSRLASENILPETAAVTTFRHGTSVKATIQFVDRSTWEELKSLYADNPKHVDTHRVSSWEKFSVPQKIKTTGPEEVIDLNSLEQEYIRPIAHTVTLELQPPVGITLNAPQEAIKEFREKLKEYTTATRPLHCLVDRIDISVPADILDHGVLLIDTPGLDDTVRFRVALTEQVVTNVDAVLLLTKSGASYSQSEKDFLLSLLRKGTVKQLIVVVTHIDETYQKVLEAAELNDEEPMSIAECIAQEHIKIAKDIADTLNDLTQDESLNRYQELLGEIPIAFTSCFLHRKWNRNRNLSFVINSADPGGVEQLKKDLLKLLSTESRLAKAAEKIITDASHCLIELQNVLQTKLLSLKTSQNKEVAEQKLHTFHNEFGAAREGFTRSIEQQAELLSKCLAEQPESEEILLSLIESLADQSLSVFETADMGRHWNARRHGGWGYLSGLQASTAKLIFPRVQQLLDNRTTHFTTYVQRFEEALLRLSKSSEEISERLELGTNVPLDISGRLRGVLDRSIQNAQAMIANEERNVQQLLDKFVTDRVADLISEKRRLVADIWARGTTKRQNEQIADFYREVKSLLKAALQSHLKDRSQHFSEFLLAESKSAPRDALDSVDVLLEQANDNIIAAAALHLSGQTDEAIDSITKINVELIGTLDRIRSVLPASHLLDNRSTTHATANVTPPKAIPTNQTKEFVSMTESEDWANEVQAAATECISRLQLMEGSTGWSYEKLFEARYLKGALHLSLIDPYLSKSNQLRNLQEFLMHVAEAAKPKSIEIVTSNIDEQLISQQNRILNAVTKDLFQHFGVALTLRRENGLHDRYLRLSHGVLFKLGRGLDVYKPATGLATHRPASRHVRATEIDVFVVPGHVLTSVV
jgi:signal recognition particle receptor subunit beta